MRCSVRLMDPCVDVAATDKKGQKILSFIWMAQLRVFSEEANAEGHGNKSSGKEVEPHSTQILPHNFINHDFGIW